MPLALNAIAPNHCARILQLRNPSPQLAQRLIDMGLTRGAVVRVIRLAPLGDPIVIQVMGYSLALRRAEAAAIDVEPLSPEPALS